MGVVSQASPSRHLGESWVMSSRTGKTGHELSTLLPWGNGILPIATLPWWGPPEPRRTSPWPPGGSLAAAWTAQDHLTHPANHAAAVTTHDRDAERCGCTEPGSVRLQRRKPQLVAATHCSHLGHCTMKFSRTCSCQWLGEPPGTATCEAVYWERRCPQIIWDYSCLLVSNWIQVMWITMWNPAFSPNLTVKVGLYQYFPEHWETALTCKQARTFEEEQLEKECGGKQMKTRNSFGMRSILKWQQLIT